MEPLFNFKIDSVGELSQQCIQMQLEQYAKLCEYIQSLPYGRNADRSNYKAILKEQKGTCSTKHAFLATVALENNVEAVLLCIGMYRMTESNTKGVGPILQAHNLDYIPEAHTYLKIANKIFDFTRTMSNDNTFEKELLLEEFINPDQIGVYKVEWHQNYLKHWIITENIPYTFSQLWQIRESCIAVL